MIFFVALIIHKLNPRRPALSRLEELKKENRRGYLKKRRCKKGDIQNRKSA